MATLIEMKALINSAWARYACDSFGDDTVGHFIWERVDGYLDLITGDGSDTDTFPTLTVNSDHDTAYYEFDGVDDYVSSWPTMPTSYTVVAALSDSYPDSQPYVQICNDDTIETLLTTPGSFNGNLHNLIIFDSVLDSDDLKIVEHRMLRRLWRDTFVDPYTARLIRDTDCVVQIYGEYESDPFVDYAQGIGSTDVSTSFDVGITFPETYSSLVMDDDVSVNGLTELSIVVESTNWDMQEGCLISHSDFAITLSVSGTECTINFNGYELTIDQVGYKTLGVTWETGSAPSFFANGYYIGDGVV
jgi:hypothetical protein